MRAAILASFALWVAVVCLAQAPAPADGQALFEKRCGGCHALDRDKEGPRLGGVFGRTAGSVATFQYSDALKKSGIVWDAAKLEQWLTNPEALVPDNDMSFHVGDAGERAILIAWLKQKSSR